MSPAEPRRSLVTTDGYSQKSLLETSMLVNPYSNNGYFTLYLFSYERIKQGFPLNHNPQIILAVEAYAMQPEVYKKRSIIAYFTICIFSMSILSGLLCGISSIDEALKKSGTFVLKSVYIDRKYWFSSIVNAGALNSYQMCGSYIFFRKFWGLGQCLTSRFIFTNLNIISSELDMYFLLYPSSSFAIFIFFNLNYRYVLLF